MRLTKGGRAATVVAAPATVAVGLAIAGAPWGPWSTAFLLVAPAVPALVSWRALEWWVRLLLAVAVAVVVDAVVAEVMLVTGHWSPPAGVAAVGVVSALLWIGNTVAWKGTAESRRERTT